MESTLLVLNENQELNLAKHCVLANTNLAIVPKYILSKWMKWHITKACVQVIPIFNHIMEMAYWIWVRALPFIVCIRWSIPVNAFTCIYAMHRHCSDIQWFPLGCYKKEIAGNVSCLSASDQTCKRSGGITSKHVIKDRGGREEIVPVWPHNPNAIFYVQTRGSVSQT